MSDRFTVTVGAAAPGTARRELGRRAAAYDMEGESLDDAMLAVSEVVTNVVRHSDVEDGETITIAIDRRGESVRVCVEQPTVLPSIAASFEPRADGGMGLAIVEKITSAWGARSGPPGSVWFEVPAASTA